MKKKGGSNRKLLSYSSFVVFDFGENQIEEYSVSKIIRRIRKTLINGDKIEVRTRVKDFSGHQSHVYPTGIYLQLLAGDLIMISYYPVHRPDSSIQGSALTLCNTILQRFNSNSFEKLKFTA